MIFLDTSVLVAVAHTSHDRHQRSLELWNRCARKDTAVSVHTLAELYSSLTGMPPAFRIPPRDAVLAVETFLQRLTPISLTPDDYTSAIARAARLGLSGGILYDVLLLECARKCKARKIYTWNVRHFRLAAPDLSDRIVAP